MLCFVALYSAFSSLVGYIGFFDWLMEEAVGPGMCRAVGVLGGGPANLEDALTQVMSHLQMVQ